MRDAGHIASQLSFLNTGPAQTPGVVVVVLVSAEGPDLGAYDPDHASLLVVVNARPSAVRLPWPGGAGGGLRLHPALAELAAGGDAAYAGCAADAEGRAVEVAGRTAAVFVEPRAAR
jgi:pullulanase